MYGDSQSKLSEGQAAAGPVPWVVGQPGCPVGRGLGLSVDRPWARSPPWGVSRPGGTKSASHLWLAEDHTAIWGFRFPS